MIMINALGLNYSVSGYMGKFVIHYTYNKLHPVLWKLVLPTRLIQVIS